MKRTIFLTALALMISAGITAQSTDQTQNQNQVQNQNQTGTQAQTQVQNQSQRGNRSQSGIRTQRQVRDRISSQDCINQQRNNSQVQSAGRNSAVCNSTMQRSGIRMSRGATSGRR